MAGAVTTPGGGAPNTQGSETHHNIGTFLLVLPFLLFLALIAVWPVSGSPDAISLEDAIIAQEVAQTRITTAAGQLSTAAPGSAAASGAESEKKLAEAALERAKTQQREAEVRLRATGTSGGVTSRWTWVNRLLGPSAEIRLLVLVMISAAIGSSIQAAKSFAAFTGRNEYNVNWNWWYFLRFPTGIGIALLMYCVIRGGFMPGSLADQSVAGAVNPFGVAGLSALVGMFSREAADKLQELFGTFFRTSEGTQFPSVDPIPDVAHKASGKALEIDVKGKNFKQGVTAQVDGAARKVVSAKLPTSLVVALEPADVATLGDKKLKVINAGGQSTEVTFKVVAMRTPKLTTVTGPAAGTPADAALAIVGTDFANGAVLVIGAKEFATTFTSATRLDATVPRADLPAGAKAMVENPSGLVSNEVAVVLA